jgi:heterodisulfide reductase subunit B
MNYAYYPGCSLKESAREYDLSTRAVMESLGAKLTEIPDWTCCGASAAEAVDDLLSLALPARNLALAERHLPGLDVLAPCSACYLNLRRAQEETNRERRVRDEVNAMLGAESLSYGGGVTVRHLLDVLVNDIGPERIEAAVRHFYPLLKVAPYSGCQILRPYRVFDDPEHPTALGRVLKAMYVDVLDWKAGNACCGASLAATKHKVALPAIRAVLDAASEADCIVTVCPMCQMNLELYQKEAGRRMPVLYLTQLMGLALGLPEQLLRVAHNLSVTPDFLRSLPDKAAEAATT